MLKIVLMGLNESYIYIVLNMYINEIYCSVCGKSLYKPEYNRGKLLPMFERCCN